jgi:hypothetical protein
MKRPGFFEGISLALAVSIVGSLLFSILNTVLPGNMVLRLLIAGVAFAYIVYLLSRSNERLGRVTVLAVWAVAALSIWMFSPSFVIYVVLHLILMWLVRSLYFYSSVLSALTDMGLSVLGFLGAVWAVSWTSSLFLGLWCFFLMQALFVFIPSNWKGRSLNKTAGQPVGENPFDLAHRAAEAAVRKLSQ